MKKLMRNDPCWCGSKKPYCECHMDFDKKIESVNADIVRLDLLKKNRSTFVPKCQELLNAWDTFDAADKNTALKNVIERIDFAKTEKNARGQRHSSFSIDVFPRISR